jgi:hypothetical protein
MPSIRNRGLLPLTHAALVSLCVTLPACIEDIYVPPGMPGDGIVQPPNNPQVSFYDVVTFEQRIQPLLDDAGCATAGCHSRAGRVGTFVLWERPAPGSVEMWSNLQYVASMVDLAAPSFQGEVSAFYVYAINRHANSAIADPPALEAWLEEASARFQGGDPGDGDPDRFDPFVFETQIQPILDAASCSNTGCHERSSGLAFSLYPRPEPGSGEMAANRQAVLEWVELDVRSADETTFYLRATDAHRGASLPDSTTQVLADWIQRGLDIAAAE